MLDRGFTPEYYIMPIYKQPNITVNLGNTIPPANTTARPDIYTSLPNEQSRNSRYPDQIKIMPVNPTRTLKANVTYAIALTDPDATSHAKPAKAQMCHWVVTVTMTQSTQDDAKEETDERFLQPGGRDPPHVQELIKYLPPSPPPKTGLHRYVFVLLQQKKGHTGDDVKKPKDRPHWGKYKASRVGLSKVLTKTVALGFKGQGKGVREWAKENHMESVGANFFYAENEKQ